MELSESDVEALAEEAGLGTRNRAKLLKAFRKKQGGLGSEGGGAPASPPRGHGAPAPDRKPVATF